MSIYNFYIYAYLRQDGSPYYIGKGKNKRAWKVGSHKGHRVHPPKNKSRIVIMESNLSEIGALALERRYIRWYGRKDNDTGILHNRTDGGEGTSGMTFTEDHRRKMSDSLKGRTFSDTTRKRMSEAAKGRVPWNKGKKWSSETKRKMSESSKGSSHDEQTKQKIAEGVRQYWRQKRCSETPQS